MNLAGNTTISVNGKHTRICGSVFNKMLRKHGASLEVRDENGNLILPSKGLGWNAVAEQIRAGKKVQAKVDGETSKKSKKVA